MEIVAPINAGRLSLFLILAESVKSGSQKIVKMTVFTPQEAQTFRNFFDF
jgi:hypothetical protein